jgi:NADH dehydrogenase FAD-containing subunit
VGYHVGGGAEPAAALGRQSQKLKMKVSLVDCDGRHLWKLRLREVAAGLLGPQRRCDFVFDSWPGER